MRKEISGENGNETELIWFAGFFKEKGMGEARYEVLQSFSEIKTTILDKWGLVNYYMKYSYSYGTMMQDHGPYPRHIEVDERDTLQRSNRPGPALVLVHLWCWNHNVYGHRSSGNNQRQECGITPFCRPTCVEQCKIDGPTDDGKPTWSSTDRANF